MDSFGIQMGYSYKRAIHKHAFFEIVYMNFGV